MKLFFSFVSVYILTDYKDIAKHTRERNIMTPLAATQNNVCLDQVKEIKVNGLDNLVNRLLKLAKKVNHNWATRRQLALLSSSALKDIGLTQADVYEELNKSLWK